MYGYTFCVERFENMENNLLIIGAGIYGLVAKEIAESMRCFDRIAFVDDRASAAPDGMPVIGTTADLEHLRDSFNCVIIAIGNPSVRKNLLDKAEGVFTIVTLISPQAYISPSAKIAKGCIIEPMAVIHAGAVLGQGTLVSAGAVVNHAAVCGEVVHVDCNAVVPGSVTVPEGTKVCSCTVYQKIE